MQESNAVTGGSGGKDGTKLLINFSARKGRKEEPSRVSQESGQV